MPMPGAEPLLGRLGFAHGLLPQPLSERRRRPQQPWQHASPTSATSSADCSICGGRAVSRAAPPRMTLLSGRRGCRLRWFALLAALRVTLARGGSPGFTGSESSAKGACNAGLLQRFPIILGCHAGLGKHEAVLEKDSGTFSWFVAAGTKDLEVNLSMEPSASEKLSSSRLRRLSGSSASPSGSLEVRCEEPPEEGTDDAPATGELLVAEHGGLLNKSSRTASINGTTWSWIGLNSSSDAGFGFAVHGSVGCTAKISLTNKLSSKAAVNVTYKWGGISPCPVLTPGCTTCPEDVCPPHGTPAICDGGYSYLCSPSEAPPLGDEQGEEAAKKAAADAAKLEAERLEAESKMVAADMAEMNKEQDAEKEEEQKMAARERQEDTAAHAEALASEQGSPVASAFQSEQLFVHIHGVTFSRISSKHLEELSTKLAESLAQDLVIPVDHVRDLAGKEKAVSLSAGSLIVQSSIQLPSGKSVSDLEVAAESEATKGHIVAIVQEVLGEDSDAFSDGAASVGIDSLTFSSSTVTHTSITGGPPSSPGVIPAAGAVEETPSTSLAAKHELASSSTGSSSTTTGATTTSSSATTTTTTTVATTTTTTALTTTASTTQMQALPTLAGSLATVSVVPPTVQTVITTLPPLGLQGPVTQYPGQVPVNTPYPAAPLAPGQVQAPVAPPYGSGYVPPTPGAAANGAYSPYGTNPAAPAGAMPPQSVHATGEVGSGSTGAEDVGETSWRATAGVLIVGGGALVCCISIGFLCLFMAVRRMATEHEEQEADRFSNLGSEFDRLPTGESNALTSGAQSGPAPRGGYGAGGGYEPLNSV